MSLKIFVDDSGNKKWGNINLDITPDSCGTIGRVFCQNNYFVLAGVIVDDEIISELNYVIDAEKIKVFGTKMVEIHSSNIRNPIRRKRNYTDKYHIHDNELRNFIEEFWYDLFKKFDLKLIAVVVGKHHFSKCIPQETPLEMAAKALLKFVHDEINEPCEIIFDQMDNRLKAVSGDQGKILRIASLNDSDSNHSIAFDRSSRTNLLQIADTVAYNVWRQFVDFGNAGRTEAYPYFNAIRDNFLNHGDNKRGRIIVIGEECR